jgi:hypothetical protein
MRNDIPKCVVKYGLDVRSRVGHDAHLSITTGAARLVTNQTRLERTGSYRTQEAAQGGHSTSLSGEIGAKKSCKNEMRRSWVARPNTARIHPKRKKAESSSALAGPYSSLRDQAGFHVREADERCLGSPVGNRSAFGGPFPAVRILNYKYWLLPR